MRTFGEGGATRDTDEGKLDMEAFLSPQVLLRYGAYMHQHRTQPDGSVRDGDNWQKGIPKDAYIKSAFRHFIDVWQEHRGHPTEEGVEEALCALLFNTMGYLHEELKTKQERAIDEAAGGLERVAVEDLPRDLCGADFIHYDGRYEYYRADGDYFRFDTHNPEMGYVSVDKFDHNTKVSLFGGHFPGRVLHQSRCG